MAGGLETTFAVLGKTHNEAAVRLLIDALDAPDRSLQIHALRTLLGRRSTAGQHELLRRWHTLSERWKTIIAESGNRFSNVIRETLLSHDAQLHSNGCDAVLLLREYDVIPNLLAAAEDMSHPCSERSAETLLLLAEAFSDELAAPRDYHNRRDPRLVHAHAVGALEHAVQRFDQHRRREIVEAFLLLAGHGNALLNHILQHPSNSVYEPLVQLLLHSPRRGVMQLLLDSLGDPRASAMITGILAQRTDVRFVRHLLKRFADGVPRPTRRNLRRIGAFDWLAGGMHLLSALNGEEQRGAIHLSLASGMSRASVFEVVHFLLAHGATEARREAVVALSEFRTAEADASVLRALEDDDPLVRATAVRQLRDRGTRRAMATLFELTDSPDAAVRQAARESLAEFNFPRFLVMFSALDDDTLDEVGRFVRRVDPQAIEGLRHELTSTIRIRRSRAIRMAVAMTAVPEVESLIINLLFDEDHVIRAAAAAALSHSPSVESRIALLAAASDRSDIVCAAVAHSLQTLAASDLDSPPPSNSPLPAPASGAPAPATEEAAI